MGGGEILVGGEYNKVLVEQMIPFIGIFFVLVEVFHGEGY